MSERVNFSKASFAKVNLKLKASKFDEVYTPSGVVESLRKHLPKTVKTVWCPFDTLNSNIVKDLVTSGYTVIYSHIKDGKDFFNWEPEEDYDIIISNPPYSIKDSVLERCVSLKKPFAMLLPIDALCGTRRLKIYKKAKWPLSVITLAKRVDFTGKKSPWFNVCWICSISTFKGKLIQEE